MSPSPSDIAMWQWIVSRYESGQTKQNCLKLQDQFGMDIIIILWLCWLAKGDKMPTTQGFSAAQHVQSLWQNTCISGFRKTRYALRAETMFKHQANIKNAVLALELTLEKYYLEDLARITELQPHNDGPRAEDSKGQNKSAADNSAGLAAHAIRTWLKLEKCESAATKNSDINTDARNTAIANTLRGIFNPVEPHNKT